MTQPNPTSSSDIRLAELMAALSIATDLGMGQPLEFALGSCVLSVRLGEALGFGEEALREVYYQALLRYIGCNVETDMLAAIVGDEQAMRADFAEIDNGNIAQVVSVMVRFIRQANAGASTVQMQSMFSGHCEVAKRLAERLGFGQNIVHALGQLYERWDGRGLPNGLKGEAIAPAVLVVTLAQDAVIFHRLGGVEAAVAVARERNGTAYAPQVVVLDVQDRILQPLSAGPGKREGRSGKPAITRSGCLAKGR